MSGSEHLETRTARSRLWIFAFMVLALSALSFHGALDNLARDHAEEATREALLAYGTIRVLNMGVSVLQTSELGGLIGTVQIGQLLDPINDAAERASTALVWSIGSLFLQRILLGIASSTVVRWVFVASGLLALFACLPLASIVGFSAATMDGVRRATVRFFAIAGILRFLVPAFVASSYLASEALLQEMLDENQEAVSEIAGTIDIWNGSDSVNDEERAEGLRGQIATLQAERADIEERLREVNGVIGDMEVPLRCRLLRMGCPPELESLQEERDRLDDDVETIDEQAGEAQSELDCVEDEESCGESLWDWLRNPVREARELVREARELLGNLLEWAVDLPERLTYLMISLLVKCIVFPILFLLLASKCGGYVVRRAAGLRLHVSAG